MDISCFILFSNQPGWMAFGLKGGILAASSQTTRRQALIYWVNRQNKQFLTMHSGPDAAFSGLLFGKKTASRCFGFFRLRVPKASLAGWQRSSRWNRSYGWIANRSATQAAGGRERWVKILSWLLCRAPVIAGGRRIRLRLPAKQKLLKLENGSSFLRSRPNICF